MNKIYEKQTWHNDAAPALSDDNLNHIEDGIDAIDTRLAGLAPADIGAVPNTRTVNGHALNEDISLSASDVGLGNVPNVTTNNQTPTFNEYSTRANINSGETLATIMGKVKKWFSDLKTVALTGSYNDLTDKPTIPPGVTVDQTYDPTSTNAQSGTAVSQAVGGITPGSIGISSANTLTSAGDKVYNFDSSKADGWYTLATIGDDLHSVVILRILITDPDKDPGTEEDAILNGFLICHTGDVENMGLSFYGVSCADPYFTAFRVINDFDESPRNRVACLQIKKEPASGYVNSERKITFSKYYGDLLVSIADTPVKYEPSDWETEAYLSIPTVYSTNAVLNEIIVGNIKGNAVTSSATSGSDKLITSGGVNTALAAKQNKLTAGTGITIENDVISAAGSGVSSFNGRSGSVSPQSGDYTAAMVGLGNVDNTSDANKPVSTATQTALDGKVGTSRKVNGHALTADVTVTASDVGAIPTTQKGANSGVAELDSNGKVPSSQLPSYVDDVLEYPSQSAFPSTGESGKIYVATDTNKTYRWSGTDYVEISPSLALGETSSTAYRGDRGKTAYDHASETKAGQTASGLYKVASTAQGHISSLTAVQKSDITALGIPSQDTTYTGTGLISINASNVISTTAEANQNAFSNVKVGSTTVAADSKTDTLELVAGSNVTLTPDATNDKVTIAATDTTYESKSAASGGTAVSLVTTGEKYTWGQKQSALSTMSSSELTTGTATTARSVRADYLKSGVNSLIDTKINALDGGTIGTPSASKTLTALSETNGNISATFGNIAIAESQVTNLTTDLAAKLPLAGGTVTGDITLGSNGDTYASIVPGASGECYLGDSSHTFDHAYIEDLHISNDVSVGGKVTVTGDITATNLGTASAKNVPSSGNASSSQVVMGNDTRLSDARNAADVSAWAKAASKPTYTKSEVGLGNVDNTSDANKPISTATQTALNGKADTSSLTDGSVTKIGTGNVGSSTQPVYINGGVPTAAGYLMTQTSTTVASSGWTAENYTSPTGTVYGYKKDVTISGMTASSYIDGDISSGTYTGAYAFESASGKAVIRTATQPSSSLTFKLYYQI